MNKMCIRDRSWCFWTAKANGFNQFRLVQIIRIWLSIFRIRVINRRGHVRLNKTSGKRRIGQAVKAVCQILLFLLWKKNLKYIITGYDIVLDRYQYLLYNTKCGTAKLFRTRSVTWRESYVSLWWQQCCYVSVSYTHLDVYKRQSVFNDGHDLCSNRQGSA